MVGNITRKWCKLGKKIEHKSYPHSSLKRLDITTTLDIRYKKVKGDERSEVL